MQLKRVAVELQNKLKVVEKERDQVKGNLKKEKKDRADSTSKPDLKLLGSLNDMIAAVDTLKGTVNEADEQLIEPVKPYKDQLQVEYTPRVKIML